MGLELAAAGSSALKASATKLTTGSLRTVAYLIKPLIGSPVARRKDTPADRIANVSRIQISPRRFVAYQGSSQSFAAVPVNAAGETVQGVKFTWQSSDSEKVQIGDTGRATFLTPGLTRIVCRAGTVEASVPVLVRAGRRPGQSDREWMA